MGTLCGGGRDGLVGASLRNYALSIIHAIFYYLHLHKLKIVCTYTPTQTQTKSNQPDNRRERKLFQSPPSSSRGLFYTSIIKALCKSDDTF